MKIKGIFKTGFTLMEIMIVIIIIGILVRLAIPRYTHTIENSRTAEALDVLGAIRNAQMRYVLDNDGYTNSLTNLDINMSSAGRFFTFSAVSGGNPFNAVNDIIATAVRTGGSYTISMTENGTYSTAGGSGYIPPTQSQEMGYTPPQS
ncbi:MAG: prepilin-type N-terminal cleavage/methylation domain-containing protein [Candidatus Omnitrophica bacterium]|nr:prepilin-type N-terminal cleavage/methylation domain-containing protein [Candidatus Omnitrophota bacterium]MDD5352022.1 prepilin-type N-terminal cleavage/methylation domain-containing protein [Candidatus Omnitrophota bacterium]MDD5551076.1 prepilin-type N-terminal cleavage/methylation domain-containing protein [Candidatus Omnitrophota bacterium]